LQDALDAQLKEALRCIQAASPSPTDGTTVAAGASPEAGEVAKAKLVHDVISVYQLKSGIEAYNR
jgi:hypothetical protein